MESIRKFRFIIQIGLLAVLASQSANATPPLKELIIATQSMNGAIQDDHVVFVKDESTDQLVAKYCERGSLSLRPEARLSKCRDLGSFTLVEALEALAMTEQQIRASSDGRRNLGFGLVLIPVTAGSLSSLMLLPLSEAAFIAASGVLIKAVALAAPIAATAYLTAHLNDESLADLQNNRKLIDSSERVVIQMGQFARIFPDNLRVILSNRK